MSGDGKKDRGRTRSSGNAGKPGPGGPRGGAPRRRGRPPGSTAIKPGTAEAVANYIRGGVLPKEAARLVGLKPRSFYEAMERGEGRHPSRRATPIYRHFADTINEAIAAAVGAAQSKLYAASAEKWLNLRLRAGAEPASGPRSGEALLGGFSDEEVLGEVGRMVAVLLEEGTLRLPACAYRDCPCGWHEAPGTSVRSSAGAVRALRPSPEPKPAPARTRTKKRRKERGRGTRGHPQSPSPSRHRRPHQERKRAHEPHERIWGAGDSP